MAAVMLGVAVCSLLATGAVAAVVEDDSPRPTFLEAKVGHHVVFSCPIDFPYDIPIPYSLRWSKERRVVFAWSDDTFESEDPGYRGRIAVVPQGAPGAGGAVNLTAIRESDGGWYECRVHFPNRSPSTRPNGTWFHLTVEGGTLLAIPPINVTTLEGEPAHFPCVTKRPDAAVTWYKDGVALREVGDLAARSRVDQLGSLTIERTDMLDGGELSCVVLSPDGERQTAAAFLDVQYKAKVVFAPPEVFLPYGRNATLDCHFRANPPLTNLRWERDGFLLDPYNVPGVFYRRNGSLFFASVNESHEGRYTCTPTNDLGSAGPSRPMAVVVQRPPVFTALPHNLYLRKPGDAVEMACDAVDGRGGRRRPSLIWLRVDGTPLPLDRVSLLNGNLTLRDLRPEDAGLYQCVASNEAATISAQAEVALEATSVRAPHNLTAVAGETEVNLHWEPGLTAPHHQFSVWYRPADSPDWRTAPVDPHSGTEATVAPLAPGRVYEFMVLRHDAQGDGMFSRAVRVKTEGVGSPRHEPDAPLPGSLSSFQLIGPPRNLGVNLTEAGHVVWWEEPAFGASELRAYRVHWATGPDELSLGSAETTHTFLLVPDLEGGSTYYFQVSAISSNEYTAPSAQLEVHVPSQQSLRALAVASAVGLAFLLVAAAAAVYLRQVYSTSPTK